MAYIVIESSVRTHRKMLAAGPAACWLWACGLGYCQEGLTDGLIPASALSFLGVKSPQKLAAKLVSVGLWDDEPNGWRVHDYHEHNKSAKKIRETMRLRGEGGREGGRPKKTSKDNLQGLRGSQNPETLPETLSYPSTTVLPSDRPTDLPTESARDEDGRVLSAEGAWNGSRKHHSGSLIDGRAQRRHQGHAWCSEREGFCIPDFLHAEFVGKLGTASADADLRAWYPAALTLFAGRSVGEDSLQFWRNNFAVWVGTVTSKPASTLGKGARAVHAFDAAYDAIQARREP